MIRAENCKTKNVAPLDLNCFLLRYKFTRAPDHILVTLYNDGPASAVLIAARITFQSRYILCQCIPSMLGPANKWNEMKWRKEENHLVIWPSHSSEITCNQSRLGRNDSILVTLSAFGPRDRERWREIDRSKAYEDYDCSPIFLAFTLLMLCFGHTIYQERKI